MTPEVFDDRLSALRRCFSTTGSVLVAFSGGVDSTLVLKVAHDVLGPRAVAVTAVSATMPALELDATRSLAAEIGATHRIVETDQLQIPEFVVNDSRRCYFCKTDLYQLLSRLRQEAGAQSIVDGTNVDDLDDDRPGLQAAKEQGVRSPLVEAGLTKDGVRSLARHLGLSNWNKPAAACLSSRIPRGVPITFEKLSRVEQAEAVLVREGFRQLRVRDGGDTARIEVEPDGFTMMDDAGRRQRITAALKDLGFKYVTLDLEGYRKGKASS